MLSKETIEIVKSTVPLLQEHGRAITREFYSLLFEKYPALQNVFNMSHQRSGEQPNALADAVLAYATYIDNLEVLLPAVKRIAAKHASVGVLPEHYPVVGETLLAAIQRVLSLPSHHPALTAWGEAYGVLADVFIKTEEDLYQNSEWTSGGWRGFKPFVIKEILREASGIKSFLLYPKDGQSVAQGQPGQYIGLKVQGAHPEFEQIRQYSISEKTKADHYRISVKAETEGLVSSWLHRANVGDEVMVSAPQGDFVHEKSPQTQVFISGGVGITPLMAMMENALSTRTPGQKLVFIACSRDAEAQAFNAELKQFAKQADVVVKRVYENGSGGDAKGYLTLEHLKQWIPDRQAAVYFCGPLLFMSSVQNMLTEAGFDAANLHHEIFGPATAI